DPRREKLALTSALGAEVSIHHLHATKPRLRMAFHSFDSFFNRGNSGQDAIRVEQQNVISPGIFCPSVAPLGKPNISMPGQNSQFLMVTCKVVKALQNIDRVAIIHQYYFFYILLSDYRFQTAHEDSPSVVGYNHDTGGFHGLELPHDRFLFILSKTWLLSI